jgi:hypothetical protein
VQRGGRDGQLLGQRTVAATADADLLPLLAHMLVPAPAAPADPVAEHRVAHDAAPDPGRVDAVAHGGDGARPLVAQPHREARVPLVQVGHLAGEELHIGAAHPDPLDVDDHLPRSRLRGRYLLDRALQRSGEDEGPHRRRAQGLTHAAPDRSALPAG